MEGDNLTLREHLTLLGLSPDVLAFSSGVPKPVVMRALAGQEIVRPHAEAIAYQLSEHHGLKHQVGYAPEDIKDLKVHEPSAHVVAQKTNLIARKLAK